MIFKALYEQDKLFYEALEPLEIHEEPATEPTETFETSEIEAELNEL